MSMENSVVGFSYGTFLKLDAQKGQDGFFTCHENEAAGCSVQPVYRMKPEGWIEPDAAGQAVIFIEIRIEQGA